ncbi:MAG: hypothetical protein OXU45_03935, partial [Candidatus Melainabacteria bacterium]|nr:hypothetical protein [Candidatus Melainabacteria bacterium]
SPAGIPVSRQQQVQKELDYIFTCRVRDDRIETRNLRKLDDVLRVDTQANPYTDQQKQELEERIASLDQTCRNPSQRVTRGPGGAWVPIPEPGFNEIIGPLIESLEAVLSFEEANHLISKLHHSSNQAKLSTLLQRVIEIIPTCLNAANETGFDIRSANKSIAELSRYLVHYEDTGIHQSSIVNELKWVFLSAGRSKIDGDELANLWVRLFGYKKDKYEYFDIYNSIIVLPTLFEAGLNCKQIGDILIALDGEMGDSQTLLDPLRRAVDAYHRLRIDPGTIYQSFMKFTKPEMFPLGSIDTILDLGTKILGLTPAQVDEFLQDASVGNDKGFAICSLPGKLEKLELFAEGLDSQVAVRLRNAILDRDFDYIDSGDLVLDAHEVFVSKDGALTSSNAAYYTERSREEGTTDLRNLAMTSDQEGVWLYSDSSNTWYCLGGKTSLAEGAVKHQYYADLDYAQLPRDLELYHMHPQKLAYKPGVNLNARVIDDPDVLDKVTALEMAMPSLADLLKFRYILEATRPDDLSFKIIHENGTTNVNFMPCTPDEFQPLVDEWKNIKSNFFKRMLQHTDLERDDFIALGIRSFNEDLGDLIRISL